MLRDNDVNPAISAVLENMMFAISCTIIVKVRKIHYLFAVAPTRPRWVKPSQPVEPKY